MKKQRIALLSVVFVVVLSVQSFCEMPFTGTNVKVGNDPTTVVINGQIVPASAGTGGASSSKTYTVKSGDSLYAIAERLLGDGDRYMELVDLNAERYPSLKKNPNLIFAGWTLTLPGGAQTDSSSSSSETMTGTVVVDPSLNIRNGPWGRITGSLRDGDKVTIVGTSGDWYKIKVGSGYGYVHANYVSTPKKAAGKTPVDGGSSSSTPASSGGSFGAAPCSPMPSRTSSEYGPRDLFGHSYHYGIDLPVPTGTRLNALGNGVVIAAGYESGGGRFVKVRYDNGYESFMCHLQSYSVSVGQRVSNGQEIARSDNTGEWTTGAHLHLAIKKNGSYVNPRSVPGLPLPPR